MPCASDSAILAVCQTARRINKISNRIWKQSNKIPNQIRKQSNKQATILSFPLSLFLPSVFIVFAHDYSRWQRIDGTVSTNLHFIASSNFKYHHSTLFAVCSTPKAMRQTLSPQMRFSKSLKSRSKLAANDKAKSRSDSHRLSDERACSSMSRMKLQLNHRSRSAYGHRSLLMWRLKILHCRRMHCLTHTKKMQSKKQKA